MTEFQPTRQQSDLADVLEMLLDKGVVINADIAVSIGDTQMLGIQVRAAIASFDTAARYGLEFPEGTDMRRMAQAVGDPELAETDRPTPPVSPVTGVNVTGADGQTGGGDGDESETTRSDETATGESDSEDRRVGSEDERSDDRITDQLGTRPDPTRPTTGGFDMISDETDEGDDREADDQTPEDQ